MPVALRGIEKMVLLLVVVAPGASAQSAVYEGWTWRQPPLTEAEIMPRPAIITHPDPWIARDKALHAGGSFLLALSSQYILEAKFGLTEGEALPVAIAAAASAGLIKEAMDSQRNRDPHFCYRDLVANGAGLLLAVGLVML